MHDGYVLDKVKEYLQAAAGSWEERPPSLPRKDVDDETDAHKQAPAPHCELHWTQPLMDAVPLEKQRCSHTRQG